MVLAVPLAFVAAALAGAIVSVATVRCANHRGLAWQEQETDGKPTGQACGKMHGPHCGQPGLQLWCVADSFVNTSSPELGSARSHVIQVGTARTVRGPDGALTFRFWLGLDGG